MMKFEIVPSLTPSNDKVNAPPLCIHALIQKLDELAQQRSLTSSEPFVYQASQYSSSCTTQLATTPYQSSLERKLNSQHNENEIVILPQFRSYVRAQEPIQEPSRVFSKQIISSSSYDVSCLVMTYEETGRFRTIISQKKRRDPGTKIIMTDDQANWRGRLRPRKRIEARASWRDRLRPRPDAITALCGRTKATSTRTGKPNGILKRRKA